MSLADTSLIEMLLAVFWLIRDLAIPGAVVFALVAIFRPKAWGRGMVFWLVSFLGTVAGLVTSEYTGGLFGIPDGIAILAVVVSGVLLAFTPQIRAVITSKPSPAASFGNSKRTSRYNKPSPSKRRAKSRR